MFPRCQFLFFEISWLVGGDNGDDDDDDDDDDGDGHC